MTNNILTYCCNRSRLLDEKTAIKNGRLLLQNGISIMDPVSITNHVKDFVDMKQKVAHW